VIADSAFVRTLIAVKTILGLNFMGCVKTAHTLFPKAAIKAWHDARVTGGQPRGGWITRYTTENLIGHEVTLPMAAVGWHDKKIKMIVSNVGSTLPCPTDSIRTRHKIIDVDGRPTDSVHQIHVTRPVMVEMFFRHFSAVDIHDHFRQGLLQMERQWRTHSWEHRLFGTLLGIVVTNAYMAYRHDCIRSHFDHMPYFPFIDILVKQLIHPPVPEAGVRTRAGAAAAHDSDDEEVDEAGVYLYIFSISL
jgi:hypothetical protein